VIIIELTPPEILEAALVGILRRLQRKKLRQDKRDQTNPGKDTGWQRDIEGALSEMAVAKHLGKYWSRGSYKEADVEGLEIRTTQHPNGRLLIREKDSPDAKYYFVRGLEGRYELCGWIYGRDAKVEKYLEDPVGNRPKAYFVPETELNKQ